MVLLAFVQTHAMVVIALVMAVVATLAMRATIGAMLKAEETAVASPDTDMTTEPGIPPRKSASGQFVAHPARSRGARLPR